MRIRCGQGGLCAREKSASACLRELKATRFHCPMPKSEGGEGHRCACDRPVPRACAGPTERGQESTARNRRGTHTIQLRPDHQLRQECGWPLVPNEPKARSWRHLGNITEPLGVRGQKHPRNVLHTAPAASTPVNWLGSRLALTSTRTPKNPITDPLRQGRRKRLESFPNRKRALSLASRLTSESASRAKLPRAVHANPTPVPDPTKEPNDQTPTAFTEYTSVVHRTTAASAKRGIYRHLYPSLRLAHCMLRTQRRHSVHPSACGHASSRQRKSTPSPRSGTTASNPRTDPPRRPRPQKEPDPRRPESRSGDRQATNRPRKSKPPHAAPYSRFQTFFLAASS